MSKDNQEAVVVDTVIIGGGQAGLCMSYALQEDGREHIVLEKGRLLEQWFSRRWDRFMVNTPQKFTRLLGQRDELSDAAMGVPLEKTIETWQTHIQERNFPVREHMEVVSVEQGGDDNFIVRVNSKEGPSEYRARNVVAAPGNYQIPNIPDCADRLSDEIQQFRVGTFTNPEALSEGAVLIVGGGQTGMQIGEALLKAGRDVFIATSRVKGSPRSYRGEDIFFWMERTGMLQMPPQALPDPNMKYDRIPIVGNDHPISHHSLARLGARFLGGA